MHYDPIVRLDEVIAMRTSTLADPKTTDAQKREHEKLIGMLEKEKEKYS